MKHTPGPWLISDEDLCVYIKDKIEEPGICILQRSEDFCDTIYLNNYAEAKANAHLIAAAPELLEACKEALGSFTVKDEFDIEARNKMRKAIAKAEGSEIE